MRILAAAPATLTQEWFDNDGNPVDPGVVTVAVTRDDGTAQTVAAAVQGSGTNPRTVAMTSTEVGALPDLLTVVWTSSTHGTRTSYTEVVGGWIVELGAMREKLKAQNFTPDKLREGRDWFEDLAERHIGVAMRPRYSRVEFLGDGYGTTLLPVRAVRQVVWATVDGDTQDLTDWVAHDYGLLEALGTFTRDKLAVVGVRHGLDFPPAELVNVGLLAAVDALSNDTRRKSRQLSVTNDALGVTQRDSVASTDYPTGIPAVDSVLNRLRANPFG